MLRRYFPLLGLLVWIASISQGFAFSLLIPLTTPATTWQVPALGYQLPGDIGGPGNIGEEYRWNIPTITYGFDASFLNYFGQQGVQAVEEAIAVLTNLGPVSAFSPDLSEFPDEALKPNGTAAALGILDLKTTTLSTLVELLGLADARRWIDALRQRATFTFGGITTTNYLVIQRNFDPVTGAPSQSINDNPFIYTVFEPLLPGNYADAIEFSSLTPDPTAMTTPLSSFQNSLLGFGVFATGLSRDDAGGLRYIYSATNKNVETLIPGITLSTNGVGNVVSPWIPWFGFTNIFTNIFGGTNVTSTNLLVNTALRPGIETLQFVRTDFDSFLGQTFVPITNVFTDTYISNNAVILQRVQRITSQPDILFVAGDLGVVGGVGPVLTRRSVTFTDNDPINGHGSFPLAGPGVLSPPAQVAFTTLLPSFINDDSFPSGTGCTPLIDCTPITSFAIWGSFGESADSIIIYPNTFSIDELEDMILGP